MAEETYGVFIPGRGTAERVLSSEREAEQLKAKWEAKFSSGFEVIPTDPDFPSVRPEEANSATNNDDSSDTMSYDFIHDGESSASTTAPFSEVGNKWNLGDHETADDDTVNELSGAINETLGKLDDDIDSDMKAVLQDASDLVQKTSLSRFECPVEACGLGHSHSDHKHDIRSAFEVRDSFTDEMKFCPYCHCGANELAMLMAFFPYIDSAVFRDQHNFEGVLEVKPDHLNALYRRYTESSGVGINRLCMQVAAELGVSEREAFPLGVREDLTTFFSRRESIENAADAAPIAQETRQKINDGREQLERLTGK